MNNPNEEENTLRLKSQMILYAIEQSLGDYVLSASSELHKLESKVVKEVEQRQTKDPNQSRLTIRQTVQRTYLNEIFQLALAASKETSMWDKIDNLKKLCSHLEIYKIRNAASHPNQPFLECYFYRLSAIATDPLIKQIGLKRISSSFRSAQLGTIEQPPADWLESITNWTIPNNIPKVQEHAITGLIGRNHELKKLKKLLLNERVNSVAITGPGGTGKTALVLEALHEMCLDDEYQSILDGIVYVTLRTKKLTAKGTKNLIASQSMSDIEFEILRSLNDMFNTQFEDFQSVANYLSDKKVLLCIDNLETLIRDNMEAFEEFNLNLPKNWRFMLTSRIAIPSSNTLPLSALGEEAAMHLARRYITTNHIDTLREETIKDIVRACSRNPLAIRLAIDIYNLGHPISNSLQQAKDMTIQFSYKNLVETLSERASQLLECLFLKDSMDVQGITDLLEISVDEVRTALIELRRTSLINRFESERGDEYQLSSSVRDLLIVNPRDIDFRLKLEEQVSRLTAREFEIDVEQQSKDVYDFFYIANSCPQHLKMIAFKAAEILQQRPIVIQRLPRLVNDLRSTESTYSGEALYHRMLAHALWYLKDHKGWNEHYQRALELDPKNPATKSFYAFACSKAGLYLEAISMYDELIEDGWDNPDNWPYAEPMIRSYLTTLLFSNNYKRILDFTITWRERVDTKEMMGGFRATACLRLASKYSLSDSRRSDGINEAVKIIDDVLQIENCRRQSLKTGLSVIKDLQVVLTRGSVSPLSSMCTDWLDFSARNVRSLMEASSFEDVASIVSSLAIIESPSNPFKNEQWLNFVGGNNS